MELSKTMNQAIEFAREHGGKLTRHPGGFWQGVTPEYHGTSFGTPTVQALVTRGVADYTEWKDGRSGRFPVEITLRATDPANPVGRTDSTEAE